MRKSFDNNVFFNIYIYLAEYEINSINILNFKYKFTFEYKKIIKY